MSYTLHTYSKVHNNSPYMTCLQQKTTIPLTMSQNDPGSGDFAIECNVEVKLESGCGVVPQIKRRLKWQRCKELVTCSQAVSHE